MAENVSTPELEQLVTQQFIRGCQAVRARLTLLADGSIHLPAHRFAMFMLPGEPIIYIGIRAADSTDWQVFPFQINVVFATIGVMLTNLTAAIHGLAQKFGELAGAKTQRGKRGPTS